MLGNIFKLSRMCFLANLHIYGRTGELLQPTVGVFDYQIFVKCLKVFIKK